jgi:hypothetical protein
MCATAVISEVHETVSHHVVEEVKECLSKFLVLNRLEPSRAALLHRCIGPDHPGKRWSSTKAGSLEGGEVANPHAVNPLHRLIQSQRMIAGQSWWPQQLSRL